MWGMPYLDCDPNYYNGEDYYAYGDIQRSYKPLRATKRNVEETIAYMLGVDPYCLKFVRLSEQPVMWKHSCYFSGVTFMRTNQFEFEDGAWITFGVCPMFGNCNVVHYYVEAPMY